MTDNVFGLRSNERTSLFIDGANFYAAGKALGIDMDYKKMRNYFSANSRLVRINYFTALHESEDEHQSIRPLIDWLDYNGFNVITKPTKEFVDSLGRRKVKGNMDIEMAVAMMEAAAKTDHLVLFTGDGDFRSVVEACQRMGARVSVVSTIKSSPPMVADELRRQADQFVDLVSAMDILQRERDDRQVRPPLRQAVR